MLERLLDTMLFHCKSTHSFLVKTSYYDRYYQKNTARPKYLPQTHQTRQHTLPATSLSPIGLCRHLLQCCCDTHARHPVCREQTNAIVLPVNQPQQVYYVQWYFPFFPCALPASTTVGPPTANAPSRSDPRHERSLFENTQNVRIRFVFVCFALPPSSFLQTQLTHIFLLLVHIK
jgi:hypothetical protein